MSQKKSLDLILQKDFLCIDICYYQIFLKERQKQYIFRLNIPPTTQISSPKNVYIAFF